MLELISVVALAAIGVAFTSYQGEQESSSAARRAALQDADEQAEPVGIFGHDVGRRLRDRMRFFGARSEEDQAALDEAEALAQRLSAEMAQDTAEVPEPDALPTAAPVAASHPESWDHDITDGEVDAVLATEPDLTDEGFEAPLEEAWASSLGALVAEANAGLETEAEAPEMSLDAAFETATRAPLNAPVIQDFDPARDQIVLEYRPEDAGNGRVGIITDDRHPGAALITLGGKVVAIVEGGEGQVTAAHVELVPEEPRGSTAAA